MDQARAERLRLLLVDDNDLFRESLVEVLNAQPQLQVVGHACCVADALRRIGRHNPHAVLLATRLPDAPSSEAIEAILAVYPRMRVIMLAGHNDDRDLFAAIRAGAQGYLLKHMPASNLVAALMAVVEGETLLFGVSGTADPATIDAHGCRDSGLDRLSRPELRVLQQMTLGASNSEIARRLYVPEQAVTGHITRIVEKLGVASRLEAAQLARRSGLRAV